MSNSALCADLSSKDDVCSVWRQSTLNPDPSLFMLQELEKSVVYTLSFSNLLLTMLICHNLQGDEQRMNSGENIYHGSNPHQRFENRCGGSTLSVAHPSLRALCQDRYVPEADFVQAKRDELARQQQIHDETRQAVSCGFWSTLWVPDVNSSLVARVSRLTATVLVGHSHTNILVMRRDQSSLRGSSCCLKSGEAALEFRVSFRRGSSGSRHRGILSPSPVRKPPAGFPAPILWST